MSLPTFLGIGVPRGGTTWLHELLASHGEVYVPSRRKELSFFDLHYDRGVEWYEKFFPLQATANRYQAIGEISPYYFYCNDCPERIARAGIGKLVLTLRHPVDRAWSYYGQKIRNGMFRGTFEEFLRSKPHVLDHGHYGRYFQHYLQYFDRQQILVPVYEEALSNVPTTKHVLARFLGISEQGFGALAGHEPINASYVARYPRLYGLAFRIGKVCREYDLDWVVNAAKRLGIRQAFGVKGKLPRMRGETRDRLNDLFECEIRELEKLLGISLDAWRHLPRNTPSEDPDLGRREAAR